MSHCTIRAATRSDLPTLADWLGRSIDLPTTAHEHLLVAESSDPALTLHATLRLLPVIGRQLPHVSYHVGCTVHAAAELGLFHRQRTLLLGHDHTGASELADIAWLQGDVPLAEQALALRLLLDQALSLLRQARAHYADRLIAELPGLGRHFYRGDPAAAAAEHGPSWRSHAASLLPRHPIYASSLPAAAEAAIAQVAAPALLLRDALEDVDLRYSHHVNAEDAGPILEAAVDDLLRQA